MLQWPPNKAIEFLWGNKWQKKMVDLSTEEIQLYWLIYKLSNQNSPPYNPKKRYYYDEQKKLALKRDIDHISINHKNLKWSIIIQYDMSIHLWSEKIARWSKNGETKIIERSGKSLSRLAVPLLPKPDNLLAPNFCSNLAKYRMIRCRFLKRKITKPLDFTAF